jgi:hypothetical protein
MFTVACLIFTSYTHTSAGTRVHQLPCLFVCSYFANRSLPVKHARLPAATLETCTNRLSSLSSTDTPTCQTRTTTCSTLETRTNRLTSLSSTDTRQPVKHTRLPGIPPTCSIRTAAECDFIGGRSHASAALCSDVDCVESMCGLSPFASPGHPDQWYVPSPPVV